MKKPSSSYFILLIINIFFSSCSSNPQQNNNTGISLPPGFNISIYADEVPGARSMTLSPKGILFVGTRGDGKVYAIVDTNKDYKADKIYTIAENLNMPNGVAF